MRRLVVGAALCFTAASCAEPVAIVEHPLVLRVVAAPARDSLYVGATLRLSASVYDNADRIVNHAVNWVSGAPAVASVDPDGLVHGVIAGAARIIAVVDSAADTVEVQVLRPVARIVIPDTLAVPLGAGRTIVPVLLAANGTTIAGRAVDWLTRDSSVAIVGPGGQVAGRGAGTTQVIAVSEGKADTTSVTVYRWPAAMHVAPDSVGLELGSFVTFAAQIVDALGTPLAPGAAVSWSSSGPGLVSVDGLGRFFVRATSLMQATAAAGGFNGSGLVTGWIGPAHGLASVSYSLCLLTSRGYPVCGNTISMTLMDTVALASIAHGAGGLGCGLRADGTARCWGSTTWTPGAETLDHLATGGDFACGLSSGGALCGGRGLEGQLGNGAQANSAVLVSVAGGHAFTAIAAGAAFACGIDVSGAAWCWGDNGSGQLGDSSAVARSTLPVAVAGGHVFTTMSAGTAWACALDDQGAAWCWGANDNRQLGVAATARTNYPVAVQTAARFTAIDLGPYTSCAATTGQQVWCWGYFAYTPTATPQLANGTRALPSFVATYLGMCGLAPDGRVYCSNGFGLNPLPGQR